MAERYSSVNESFVVVFVIRVKMFSGVLNGDSLGVNV